MGMHSRVHVQILYKDRVSVLESYIFCSLSAEETGSSLRALKEDQSALVCGS